MCVMAHNRAARRPGDKRSRETWCDWDGDGCEGGSRCQGFGVGCGVPAGHGAHGGLQDGGPSAGDVGRYLAGPHGMTRSVGTCARLPLGIIGEPAFSLRVVLAPPPIPTALLDPTGPCPMSGIAIRPHERVVWTMSIAEALARQHKQRGRSAASSFGHFSMWFAQLG